MGRGVWRGASPRWPWRCNSHEPGTDEIQPVTSALVVRDEDGEPRYVIARAAPTSAASD
jgi:hypothetical protein